MAKYAFSDAERYAVYTVHGERCYLCTKPLDMLSMEVDHVLPESLLGSAELPEILRQLGLSEDFEINSYENWLPACSGCNSKKWNILFKPSLLIQLHLQKLAAKKAEAVAAAAAVVSNREIALALTKLRRASGRLTAEQLAAIAPLVAFHRANPRRETRDAPVRLTPLYEVLADDGRIQTVKGPYGVGGGPSNPSPSARCPSCGFAAFNGARCVMCGAMDD